MRRISMRRVMMYSVLGFGLCAALLVHPAWAETLGCDVWNLNQLHDQLAQTQIEGQGLDELLDSTARQMAINEMVVADLVQARRTLAETAKLMVAMNQSRRDYMSGIMIVGRGATIEAKMADNLIRLTQVMVGDDAAPIVTKLRVDYARAYGAERNPS